VDRSDRITFNKQAGWWLKVWLWAVVGLALVLAAGLPGLTLDEQRITYSGEDWTRDLLTGDPVMLIIIVGLVALSLIVFFLMRHERRWRRAWPALLLVGLIVGGCMVVVSYPPMVEVEYPVVGPSADDPEQEIDSEAEPLDDLGIIVEVDEFTAPPAWVGLIVSTLIALFILFMFISINLFFLFAVRPLFDEKAEDEEPLTEVVEQARTAISALKQGQPLANVVLRCYADMELTLRANRGIERHQTMTVREFEQQLVRLGLPAEAVGTLTRLFETVRYGRYAPRPEDQRAAIDSLTQIVIASGGEGIIDVGKTAS
jgi:hypothetical protein